MVIYPEFAQVRGGRAKKFRPTSEAQARVNQHNAALRLARLCHANFTGADCAIHLTYDPMHNPEDDAQAQRNAKNFLRRVKAERDRLGLPAVKYLYALERGSKNGRHHIHLIISGGISAHGLRGLWGMGGITLTPLDFGETGVAGLTNYLCKPSVTKKRWIPSRNLVKPEHTSRAGVFSAKDIRGICGSPDAKMEIMQLLNRKEMLNGYWLERCEAHLNSINGKAYVRLFLYRHDPVKQQRGKRIPCNGAGVSHPLRR